MIDSPAIRFARTVQSLGAAAHALGLEVPGFRSPPRLVGVQRSIKRGPGGTVVAVMVKGRPWAAVQSDLVEGVVAANALPAMEADRARAELWRSIEPAMADAPTEEVEVPAGSAAVPGPAAPGPHRVRPAA